MRHKLVVTCRACGLGCRLLHIGWTSLLQVMFVGWMVHLLDTVLAGTVTCDACGLVVHLQHRCVCMLYSPVVTCCACGNGCLVVICSILGVAQFLHIEFDVFVRGVYNVCRLSVSLIKCKACGLRSLVIAWSAGWMVPL